MARIQVLPLTTETVGSVSSTPFVIILDHQSDDDELTYSDVLCEYMKDQLGGKAVFVVYGEWTVANVDEKLQEAAQRAVLNVLEMA